MTSTVVSAIIQDKDGTFNESEVIVAFGVAGASMIAIVSAIVALHDALAQLAAVPPPDTPTRAHNRSSQKARG